MWNSALEGDLPVFVPTEQRQALARARQGRSRSLLPARRSRAPQPRRQHIVAKQLSQFRLGDALDDPLTTLLRQITQTRQRCDLYASLLERQYDETEDEQAPAVQSMMVSRPGSTKTPGFARAADPALGRRPDRVQIRLRR
jgi:hypothetical protein